MASERHVTDFDGTSASASTDGEMTAPSAFLASRPLPSLLFWLAVSSICLVGLLLRLPDITKSLWLDEAYTAWFTSLSFHQIWHEVPVYEVHPPLYNIVLKAWTALSGRSEAGLRSLSVVASIGTILVVALSGKVLRAGAGGDRIALLAALLLAVNAGNIRFAQQARPYAFETLTAAIAILSALALIRGLKNRAAGGGLRGLWPSMVGLALGAGVTLWLHNTAIFIAYGLWIGLVVALVGFQAGRRWLQALAIGIPGLVALVIWLPFLFPFLHQSAHLASIAFWVQLSSQDLFSAWYLASGGSYPMFVVLVFAILGLGTLWRSERPSAALLSVLLFLPLATVLFISYILKPFYIDRLFEWLCPVVLGLTAIGIYTTLKSIAVRRVAMGAAVLLSVASTWDYYTHPTEDWRDVITTVLAKQQPGDIIVTNPNDLNVPFDYYAPEVAKGPDILFTPTPYPSVELVDGVETVIGTRLMEPRDQLVVRNAIAGRPRVWLIERRADFYDPADLIRKEISSTRAVESTFSETGIDVTLFK